MQVHGVTVLGVSSSGRRMLRPLNDVFNYDRPTSTIITLHPHRYKKLPRTIAGTSLREVGGRHEWGGVVFGRSAGYAGEAGRSRRLQLPVLARSPDRSRPISKMAAFCVGFVLAVWHRPCSFDTILTPNPIVTSSLNRGWDR